MDKNDGKESNIMKIRQLCKKIFSRSIKSDLSYEEAVEIINRERVFIIDVRTPEEYNKRHFKNAINVLVYNIEKINELIKDKDEIILIYCKVGQRSEMAKQILLQNGYRNVYTFDAKM